MFGTTDTSLTASGTTKIVTLKYVEPWLKSVTKGMDIPLPYVDNLDLCIIIADLFYSYLYLI